MTTIAVLGGTGHQGRGLARRFALAGKQVVIGSRDPDRARSTVASWSESGTTVQVADYATAVNAADVTVLAVPFTSIDALLQDLQPHFKTGTLVIDVTVPLTFADGKMAILEVPERSASEHVKARLPPGVRLAGAFKTIPAHVLDAVTMPLDCDEFICGDSDEARAQAAALASLLP